MKKIFKTLIALVTITFISTSVLAQERISVPKPMSRTINSVKPSQSIGVNRNSDYIDLSPEELLKKVFLKAGTCTTIENVEVQVYNWDGSNWASGADQARGLAYFERTDSDFPMESGLVLSTGNVLEAEGPNQSDSALGGGIPQQVVVDPDLQAILSKQGGYRVTNYTILEFDFQPTSRYMEFKYIFASEEYPEFVMSIFNDVFGFFLSEVGSTDKKNLALLPSTDNVIDGKSIYEVSINNVNSGYFPDNNYAGVYSKEKHNSEYFIENKKGSLTTEFDGYTINLTASAIVDPCKKYHLKIAIGNAGDNAWGSGVFLQSNSFQAGYSINNIVGGEENINYAFTNSSINYIRANISDIAEQATTIQFEFGGTAINGIDYTDPDGNPLNDVYIVEEGKNYIDIPYVIKNSSSAGKSIYLKLFCPCAGSSKYAEKTIPIFNIMTDIDLESTSVCSDTELGSIKVNVIGESNQYQYSKDSGNTWTTDNVFSNLPIGNYTIWAKESGNPIILKKNTIIQNLNTSLAKIIDQVHCGNPNFVLDAGFLSSGDIGTWTLDNSTPLAGVVIANPNSPVTNVYVPLGGNVKLNWTVKNSKCTAQESVNLLSNESLGSGKRDYVTFNIKTCNANENINLNTLCNLGLSNSSDWECITKDQAIEMNTSTGDISFAKNDMHIGSEIFRYATVDQCGNTVYNFLYINFISK